MQQSLMSTEVLKLKNDVLKDVLMCCTFEYISMALLGKMRDVTL